MNKETIEALVTYLTDMAHNSREHAAKLRAFELVAMEHREIYAVYQDHLSGIENDQVFLRSRERTDEALAKLRAALHLE